MTESYQSIANIATVVATIFAAWSAHESRQSAIASRAASESQMVLQFMKDYFEPEMNDALRTLASWRETKGEEFVRAWIVGFKQHDPEAVAVDKARRHVKAFFERAVRLFEAKLISEIAFREAAYTSGLNLYYDVVVPLENEEKITPKTRTEATLLGVLGRCEV